MARQRVVTRTVNETVVLAMVCNITEGTVVNKTLSLGGNVAQGTELKVAQKKYDSDTQKVVAIVSSEVNEIIYGMTEEEFLLHARVMNGDRKFID